MLSQTLPGTSLKPVLKSAQFTSMSIKRDFTKLGETAAVSAKFVMKSAPSSFCFPSGGVFPK